MTDEETSTDEESSADTAGSADVETSTDPLEEAGRGGRFFRKMFFLGVIVGAAVAVAYAMNQRQKLAAMSNDEIRAMLQEKLGGRVADEQLVELQNMVISKVRGTGATAGSGTASVTGTVTYREKIAMPQDAVVIVKLQDTSLMDVPAVDIGVQVIEGAGTVPVPFSVSFEPSEIIDNHTYSVRATITSGDELLWTADTAYPVITRGNPLTADLLLVAVPQPVAD